MLERRGVVLAVGRDPAMAETILHGSGIFHGLDLKSATSADEVIALLQEDDHPYSLVLADKELTAGTPREIFEFVRRDARSPYPGLALGIIGDEFTPRDVRRFMASGCVNFVTRPFEHHLLNKALMAWPTDATDFIVSGAYIGPDRWRRSNKVEANHRVALPGVEQTLASTVADYKINAETTVFRFKRLHRADGEIQSDITLRNGLRQRAIEFAKLHVEAKKREALPLLSGRGEKMEKSYAELRTSPNPKTMRTLNGHATHTLALSEQRGLLLMGAINRSLTHYTSGHYGIGVRLLDLVRSHLDGFGAALRSRITDDGGQVGRQIITSLKTAEKVFQKKDTKKETKPVPREFI